MSLLIKNAIIVNSDSIANKPQDILIEKGLIAKISSSIPTGNHKIIDAKGKLVMPGFIDLHCHLREPGSEDKETIETGSRSAAKGGFTSIFCMPNTNPVIDNAMVVEGILKEAKRVGIVNIFPIGSITKGQKGEELVDIFELKNSGCLALSDDGHSVLSSQLMRHTLEYAKMVGILIIEHCEDPFLSGKGVMNEGYNSTVLGLKGIPGISETVMIARDIEFARYFDVKIHYAHVSLKRSVELIKVAKDSGISITAEVCPHHLSLSDDAVTSFDTNAKVNPPLRTKEDVEALKKALRDGVIDCISTDHAPHTQEEKELDFDSAPFGMIGFETAAGLIMSELVNKKVISMPQMVEKMSSNPARIIGLENKGQIQEGKDADIVIVDPKKEWVVKKEDIVSKSKNSPFIGKTLTGCVEATICNGKIVYQAC